MKINRVSVQTENQIQRQGKQKQSPTFRGGIPAAATRADIVMIDEVKEFMPPVIKGMKKVCENMGEVQNIIINSLGTGLVAPIFIKWNPLSKTDEDTRTYSAWRQPVSAVLAVVTQAGITIPFNRMINNLANSGYYDAKYNKTLFQDKDYISKQIKREYPYATKQQIDSLTKAKMLEQRNTLLRMIKENKVVMSTNTGGALPLEDKVFNNLLNQVLNKQIKYEQGELDKCKNITIPKKIKRHEYYRTHNEEAKKIFSDINERLNKADNPNNIKKYVKGLIKEHKNSDPELLAIFDDILSRRGNNNKDLKIALQDKLKGILADIDKSTPENFKTSEALAESIKDMETRIRITPIQNALDNLQKMVEMVKENKTVGDIETYLDTAINKNKDHRLFKFKFSKKIAEALEKQVTNNLKGHKQITGLIVSFLTLPVSCSLLNWSYPRFMDAVFPNLSNKKHPNEIKNLVDKANNHTEVKA